MVLLTSNLFLIFQVCFANAIYFASSRCVKALVACSINALNEGLQNAAKEKMQLLNTISEQVHGAASIPDGPIGVTSQQCIYDA